MAGLFFPGNQSDLTSNLKEYQKFTAGTIKDELFHEYKSFLQLQSQQEKVEGAIEDNLMVEINMYIEKFLPNQRGSYWTSWGLVRHWNRLGLHKARSIGQWLNNDLRFLLLRGTKVLGFCKQFGLGHIVMGNRGVG